MTSDTSIVAKIDAFLDELLAGWDVYSTAILTAIFAYLGYVLFFSEDADAHPYMLAYQSVESRIRQSGESAVFRAHEVPHGYPLKSGLGIKDPGTPKWTAGRKGDLRDIWRAAVNGVYDEATNAQKRGTIYRVQGKNVVETSLDEVSKEVNILGTYLRDTKPQAVGICLADSVEFLATIFAGAFYGFKTVIIPHNLPSEELGGYLQRAGVDVLLAEAGAADVPTVYNAQPKLKSLVWVARKGSQHMDWSQAPDEIEGKVDVAVWHEVVQAKRDSVGSEVPPSDPAATLYPLATLWVNGSGAGGFVEYTQDNLVAAIASLGAALPRDLRLKPSDVLLSIDSMSRSYPLCMTLAALYVNASIALTSVAGEHVDLGLATMAVSPTLMIASSHSISDYHARYMGPQMGLFSKLGRFIQQSSLDHGVMSKPTFLSRFLIAIPTTQLSLDRLRVLFISHRSDASVQNQLTSEQLTDLRVFTGARIVYALTDANVAGAICQTNTYDYRRDSGPSHFGPPLSSVEIKLTGHNEDSGSGSAREGQIVCTGPSVIGGSCALGVTGRFRDDNTLSLST